jgi:hypothetical protein
VEFSREITDIKEVVVDAVSFDESALAGRDEVIDQRLLTVKFRQPSHEFTFGVGITLIPYPLVLTPFV